MAVPYIKFGFQLWGCYIGYFTVYGFSKGMHKERYGKITSENIHSAACNVGKITENFYLHSVGVPILPISNGFGIIIEKSSRWFIKYYLQQ